MNTKIYKAVHGLAEKLLAATNQNNQTTFDALYEELKAICEEHDNTDKDHPVQWETLADFTEDYEEALALYAVAFKKAEAIDSKDFMRSEERRVGKESRPTRSRQQERTEST